MSNFLLLRRRAITDSIGFSVSAGQKVLFSGGNLQYNSNSNRWQFAQHQYEYIGKNNDNISSTYNGWIDLFGYGTSGYNNGQICYQPYSSSTNDSYYYNNDLTGNADWGYNAITNGGNVTGFWRTLTSTEWDYILFRRTTNSGIRYAKVTISPYYEFGLLLLPDNWETSYFTLSSINTQNAAFSSNSITYQNLETIEAHGGVFLPCGGARLGNNTTFVDSHGSYWCSDIHVTPNNHPVELYFSDSSVDVYPYSSGYLYNCVGKAVRLVQDL